MGCNLMLQLVSGFGAMHRDARMDLFIYLLSITGGVRPQPSDLLCCLRHQLGNGVVGSLTKLAVVNPMLIVMNRRVTGTRFVWDRVGFQLSCLVGHYSLDIRGERESKSAGVGVFVCSDVLLFWHLVGARWTGTVGHILWLWLRNGGECFTCGVVQC